MNINPNDLSPTALTNLLDEHILREGTDYGYHEASLDHKRQQLLKLIQNNKAQIIYDENSQSCNIITLE